MDRMTAPGPLRVQERRRRVERVDWHTPAEFEIGALYVDVDSDETLEFLGGSEIAGLADMGASPYVLVFRSLSDQQLRVATELGYRRGEHFQPFVDDGIDDDPSI